MLCLACRLWFIGRYNSGSLLESYWIDFLYSDCFDFDISGYQIRCQLLAQIHTTLLFELSSNGVNNILTYGHILS